MGSLTSPASRMDYAAFFKSPSGESNYCKAIANKRGARLKPIA